MAAVQKKRNRSRVRSVENRSEIDYSVTFSYTEPVPKSKPLTMRLSSTLDALATAEARRTKRSKGAIVADLAEEAARCRLFPGIAFRGPDPRRPWILGTGLDVWELIWIYQSYEGDVERMIADYDQLTEREVRLGLAYYERFPEEIDEAIAENSRSLEHWVALYPAAEVWRVD